MTSAPLRILMGNDHVWFSGGGDAVFFHQRALYEKEGHEVYTFSHAVERPPEANERDFVALESPSRAVQKGGKFGFSASTYRFLTRVLREVRPHLVHLHLISKYPSSVFAALRGHPVIQTVHGPASYFCCTGWGALKQTSEFCNLGIGAKCASLGCVSWSQLPLYLSLAGQSRVFARGHVDLYMCPSRHLQQSVAAQDYGPTCLMRYPIDRRFLAEPPAERPAPPTVLFAGALIEQKGVATLVEAFARVRKAVPDARLRVAGRGPLEGALRARTEALGLGDAVSFEGFVGRDAMVELFRSAHLLAVPSIWRENAPVVVSEALACGLPCVGSDIGGIREFVQEGECGRTAPPREPEPLAEGMIALLRDPELWARCSANARRYALREFCPDRHREELLEVVRKHARPS